MCELTGFEPAPPTSGESNKRPYRLPLAILALGDRIDLTRVFLGMRNWRCSGVDVAAGILSGNGPEVLDHRSESRDGGYRITLTLSGMRIRSPSVWRTLERVHALGRPLAGADPQVRTTDYA